MAVGILRQKTLVCLFVSIFVFYVVDASSDECDVQSLPPLVNVQLKVDESMKVDTFREDRTLMIPKGFAIELYARVPGARHMLLLPNGDVLVSQMDWKKPPGTVAIIRRSQMRDDSEHRMLEVSTFAEGLSLPHGLALVKIGDQFYVYISESTRVARYAYNPGDTKAGNAEVIVEDLPGPDKEVDDDNYMHPFKNIAIKNNSLYVSLASTSNDDPVRDVFVDPKMCAIYRYDLDGRDRMLFAEGIRNAMGLDFDPNTGELWAVINQRDFVKYPYHDDTGKYGTLDTDYMDENPPEQFVRIVSGGNYGWPFCNPVGSESMDDLDYVADVDRNANESVVKCSMMRRTDKGLSAHSAPLGLNFWTGEAVPAAFRNGAVIGLHGSAEEIVKRVRDVNGNKVVFFKFQDGRPGPQYILVNGFSPDKSYTKRWGRPVAVLPLPDGSLLISDDHSGSIYRLYQEDMDSESCNGNGGTRSHVAVFWIIIGVVVMVLNL